MSAKTPSQKDITAFVERCLDEDIGSGDLTAMLIPENSRIEARMVSREDGVICGENWVNEVFRQLDPEIQIDWRIHDSSLVEADQLICTIDGDARAVLTAERTALNILQTLSGTATATRRYVELVSHTDARILDTRKTLPGMRKAQKYAVSCGGGLNHRTGLYDGILIKENHIRSGGGIQAVVEQALDSLAPDILLEVEVENLGELAEAHRSGARRVLLDNFSLQDMRQAVDLVRGDVELEASGNISEDNIAAVAETGVDFISIGALTKHVRALDLSLLFSQAE